MMKQFDVSIYDFGCSDYAYTDCRQLQCQEIVCIVHHQKVMRGMCSGYLASNLWCKIEQTECFCVPTTRSVNQEYTL